MSAIIELEEGSMIPSQLGEPLLISQQQRTDNTNNNTNNNNNNNNECMLLSTDTTTADGARDTTTEIPVITTAQQEQEQQQQQQSSSQLRRRSGHRRLLDRDGAFSQSRGRWRIRYLSRSAARNYHNTNQQEEGSSIGQQQHDDNNNNNELEVVDDDDAVGIDGTSVVVRPVRCLKLFWDNWFYTLAYQRTAVLMSILFFTYTSLVFIFAGIYLLVSWLGTKYKIDPDSGSTTVEVFCDMDIKNHMEALYFSLSTMTTIGYGVSDYYFGGCWTPLLLVLGQVCTAITFDAIAIGLLFQRISRGHKRGKTVLFSSTATIVRVMNNQLYLQFRIAEMRKHPLLSATVHAYCIRHERHYNYFSSSCNNTNNTRTETTNNFQTIPFITKPMKLNNSEDSHILMSLPQVIVHPIDMKSPLHPPTPKWIDGNGQTHLVDGYVSDIDIQNFLYDRQAEIIVIVEGTDELTGAPIQVRQSYTINDIVWNRTFIPCIITIDDDNEINIPRNQRRRRSSLLSGFRNNDNNNNNTTTSSLSACIIDFARFHETIPVPNNAESCPYITE